MGKQKLEKNSKHRFCAYSGKPIRNKEVILTLYAVEYVRKMGYLVTNFKIK